MKPAIQRFLADGADRKQRRSVRRAVMRKRHLMDNAPGRPSKLIDVFPGTVRTPRQRLAQPNLRRKLAGSDALGNWRPESIPPPSLTHGRTEQAQQGMTADQFQAGWLATIDCFRKMLSPLTERVARLHPLGCAPVVSKAAPFGVPGAFATVKECRQRMQRRPWRQYRRAPARWPNGLIRTQFSAPPSAERAKPALIKTLFRQPASLRPDASWE